MATTPTVTENEATCYTIRNGWAWAHIFVRHGVRQDDHGPCTWANVSVISDYGSFGFCWTHIGSGTWQAFLAKLNFGYAMGKFMGSRFMVPMTSSDAAEKAQKLVLDQRRRDLLTQEDARELWDAIMYADDGGTAHDFLRNWDNHSAGAMYRNELYDGKWEQPDPQAESFWKEIWPHFIAAIQPAETAAAA